MHNVPVPLGRTSRSYDDDIQQDQTMLKTEPLMWNQSEGPRWRRAGEW